VVKAQGKHEHKRCSQTMTEAHDRLHPPILAHAARAAPG
jgi:hypothetical protein